METPHQHQSEHGHAHAPIEQDEAVEFTILETAIRELAIAKGLFSAEDHRRFLEWYDNVDNVGPSAGARVVARAWVDPQFKERLLDDGVAACKELGIDWMQPTGSGTPSDYTYLIACENTPKIHNVIVCTLCSCYPRTVLGLPPDWYKSRNYRSRVVVEPRAVLREFGLSVGDDVTVRVHDSNADMRYLVLPMRPAGTDSWGEDKLAALVTRDCMVGVTVPKADAEVLA